MTTDTTQSVEAVLSSREKASLVMAQDLFSIRGKEAAAELAGTIGLEEEAAQEFLGAVATKLEVMDWEQRREAAARLRVAAQALGATAFDKASGVDLTLVQGSSNGNGEVVPLEDLERQQRTWLSKIVDEPIVDEVNNLSMAGRLIFANNLGRQYQTLAVRRQSEADKVARAHHLSEFMGGKSFREIADEVGTPEVNIYNRFKTMAKVIRENITPEEIVAMLPSDKVEQMEPETLNPLQRKWYDKVFMRVEGAVSQIEALSPEQIERLSELLGRRLNAYLIRRNGHDKTQRRLLQMDLLMRGEDIIAISGATGLNETNVKSELHRSAEALRERTDPEDLNNLLRGAASYDSGQSSGSSSE